MKDNFICEFYFEPENNSQFMIIKRDQSGSGNIPEFVKIYTYSERNEPPHFHIVFDKQKDTNDCCLYILKNTFFPHGKHKTILSNKQLKKLNEILSNNNYEIWGKIILYWNKNNKEQIDINLKFKEYE